MTAKIYKFPKRKRVISNSPKGECLESDKEYLAMCSEQMMEQTDYHEIIIVGVNEASEIDVIHSEPDQRAAYILDRAVTENILGVE
jgi:hypothetical protein